MPRISNGGGKCPLKGGQFGSIQKLSNRGNFASDKKPQDQLSCNPIFSQRPISLLRNTRRHIHTFCTFGLWEKNIDVMVWVVPLRKYVELNKVT